jgi:hypothetical protein
VAVTHASSPFPMRTTLLVLSNSLSNNETGIERDRLAHTCTESLLGKPIQRTRRHAAARDGGRDPVWGTRGPRFKSGRVGCQNSVRDERNRDLQAERKFRHPARDPVFTLSGRSTSEFFGVIRVAGHLSVSPANRHDPAV